MAKKAWRIEDIENELRVAASHWEELRIQYVTDEPAHWVIHGRNAIVSTQEEGATFLEALENFLTPDSLYTFTREHLAKQG